MLAIGSVLKGTYCIEGQLGEGGMARVYVASHTRIPKRFAIKVVLPEIAAVRNVRDRFRQEADILARLQHPNIVAVVDSDLTDSGLPYLVMELLEGEDLKSLLARCGALAPPLALAICRQIGDALQFAHQMGVVHRDLKPGNIFLGRQAGGPSVVKVLDFGIARFVSPSGAHLTMTPALLGTPSYMAPEQIRSGEAPVDARADQFSLAVILYEMLTRALPFGAGESSFEIMESVLKHSPRPLPPALQRFSAPLAQALSKDREARFTSIDEFLAAVGASQVGSGAVMLPSQGTPQPLHSATTPQAWAIQSTLPPVPPRRRLRVAIAASGALALLFVPLIYFARGARVAAPPPPVVTVAPPREAAVVSAPLPPPKVVVSAPQPTPPRAAPVLPEKAPARITEHRGPSPPRATPPARSVSSAARAPWRVQIRGADPAQHKLISACAQELRELTEVPPSYVITLQRSGALHVIQAPMAVRASNLQFCLRDAFTGLHPPESVTITITGGR